MKMGFERYTAEFRGGDSGEDPLDWCVVDEWCGWCGSAIEFDLTEEEARELAKVYNDKENK